MAYVEPNSTIKLYSNVPLTNDYRHTFYFSSASAQTAYFHGTISAAHTFSNQTYQRVNSNVFRAGISADSCYNCGYMAFQNTAYGNKWFYAFITGVEYVNNGCCEITYELDEFQTWFYSGSLRPCFVERCHASSDVAGDNVLPEPVTLPDLITESYSATNYSSDLCTLVLDTVDGGGYLGKTFTGAWTANFTESQATALVQHISAKVAAGQQDSIIGLVAFPHKFTKQPAMPDSAVGTALPTDSKQIAKPLSVGGGYIPRNKKLLTYPYNYMLVDCGNAAAIYRYEWFTTDTCNFQFTGYPSGTPKISCVPFYYNGSGIDLNGNVVEQLIMGGFPELSYKTDTYGNWAAYNALPNAVNTALSVATLATGAATGNVAMAGMGAKELAKRTASKVSTGLSLAGEGANFAMTQRQQEIRPPQAHGNFSGDIDTARGVKEFYFIHKTIPKSVAESIDDFFDAYGYTQSRIMTPNLAIRPQWTYIKTQGCKFTGGCPVTARRIIESAFDAGITVWKNPSNIGNYSVSNSLS